MNAAVDFETQLHTVPIRNKKLTVTVSPRDPERLIVEVALRYRGLLGWSARLLKSRDRKRYELTGLSRELFESLDGARTVENLIDALQREDKLTFLESRALVTQYLKDLMQRGLVVIVGEGE